jgi:hypothetical protein
MTVSLTHIYVDLVKRHCRKYQIPYYQKSLRIRVTVLEKQPRWGKKPAPRDRAKFTSNVPPSLTRAVHRASVVVSAAQDLLVGLAEEEGLMRC